MDVYKLLVKSIYELSLMPKLLSTQWTQCGTVHSYLRFKVHFLVKLKYIFVFITLCA